MRGNQPRSRCRNRQQRSIPACAGEPRVSSPLRRSSPVYPRVCGGTPRIPRCPAYPRGLSPRVRGNRDWCGRRWPRSGSIPACAGEPVGYTSISVAATVYPRVCGGTQRELAVGVGVVGLSPRVRGNQLYRWPPSAVSGSIPACAGEPHGGTLLPWQCQVYPRVCGGTIGSAILPVLTSGLSPRVRGNRRPRYDYLQRRGSIPACAGEPYPHQPRC